MMAILPYYTSLMFFALWAVGATYGGVTMMFVTILAFVVLPIVDFFVGVKTENETELELEKRQKNLIFFDLVFYIYSILHVAMLFVGPYLILKNNFTFFELTVIALSTGVITGGFGITIAHELCHRKNKFHQLLADFLLSSVCYTHFSTEHVQGHHQNVSTFDDPASARFGENFYSFYLRTVLGSFLSAWDIERRKLKSQGFNPWSLRNKIILGVLASVLWAIVMTWLFGMTGLFFFLFQSFVAFSLLEIVNYVEHYGLERKKMENGRYEKVRPIHSWNSSHIVSNWYLFNLERHSDHHAFASRPYPLLRHHADAPQLPAGYDSMVLLALVPPLWFKYMDPLVLKFRGLNTYEN